jgi:hypothetical protein
MYIDKLKVTHIYIVLLLFLQNDKVVKSIRLLFQLTKRTILYFGLSDTTFPLNLLGQVWKKQEPSRQAKSGFTKAVSLLSASKAVCRKLDAFDTNYVDFPHRRRRCPQQYVVRLYPLEVSGPPTFAVLVPRQ